MKVLSLKSIIHDNASSSEKVFPVLSPQIKIHPCICFGLFSLVNSSNFSPDSEDTMFSLEKAKYGKRLVFSQKVFLKYMQLSTSQDIN